MTLYDFSYSKTQPRQYGTKLVRSSDRYCPLFTIHMILYIILCIYSIHVSNPFVVPILCACTYGHVYITPLSNYIPFVKFG